MSAVLQSPSQNQHTNLSRNLHSLPHSHRSLWNVQPPPKVVEDCQLEIGEVANFFPEKGFGFIEFAHGRAFFHVSGFRIPRMMPDITRSGLPIQRLELVKSKPVKAEVKPGDNDSQDQKACRIPHPPIHGGLGLMFEVITKPDGKKQAVAWCLQEMYQGLKLSLEARYDQELAAHDQLGRYRLEFCERRQVGTYRANNDSKRMVPETQTIRTTLFDGTNIEFLKSWFATCIEDYRLSPRDAELADRERWLELQFQVAGCPNPSDPTTWEACDAETMHDFLGS